LIVATRPGGTAVSEDCKWQQGWAAIIAESHSVIIAWQQERQGTGEMQASAGPAAPRATIASIKIAPFLPMGIVYPDRLYSTLRGRRLVCSD